MADMVYNTGNKWFSHLGAREISLFESNYINLRRKENRICSDEELSQLPVVSKNNPHYKEWKLRAQSCQRLVEYLSAKKEPLKILEVGCGNGWLTNRLSTIKNAFVTGTDINHEELRQAERVFGHMNRIRFIYGGLDAPGTSDKHFDTIVFAASIQYFASLTDTIQHVLKMLRPGGEIHILDTHFYRMEDLVPASRRSEIYFQEMGCPGMTQGYFHHCINELKNFRHKTLYKPSWFSWLLGKKQNPFPWICIKNGCVE